MVEVFKRPSLTGLEVLWRWVFWVAVLAWPISRSYPSIMALAASVQASGFASLAGALLTIFSLKADSVLQVCALLLALVLLWAAASALGRKFVLRRAGASAHPRFSSLFVLGLLRWFWWAAAVALWLGVLRLALEPLVYRPLALGIEPQWVLFSGIEIIATLISFVVWLATSWIFWLALIYSAQEGWSALRSVREACQRGPLGGKLAEINLVVGIVKIALIVLALVFSACPLPFQSVESQEFLVLWTAGVLLLYFVASDYFHVVRLVAVLRMTEVLDGLPLDAAASKAGTAS